jgi:hypothetical protein
LPAPDNFFKCGNVSGKHQIDRALVFACAHLQTPVSKGTTQSAEARLHYFKTAQGERKCNRTRTAPVIPDVSRNSLRS